MQSLKYFWIISAYEVDYSWEFHQCFVKILYNIGKQTIAFLFFYALTFSVVEKAARESSSIYKYICVVKILNI